MTETALFAEGAVPAPAAQPAPAAPYRVVCDTHTVYVNDFNQPLTSLKRARALVQHLVGLKGDDACTLPHHIEKWTAVRAWTVAAPPKRHSSTVLVKPKKGGAQAWRKADFTRPPNPYARPFVARADGVELTVTDFFCGSGGSSTGLEMVPGLRVVMAVNHWAAAIETHQHNVPHADHDQANVAKIDPHRYPKTDLAWFSPECTTWSVANGKPVDYDTKWDQPDLEIFDAEAADDDPDVKLAEEAKKRSRALMGDVPRFAAVHHYRGVIVENVPDILKWAYFDDWLGKMVALDYEHKVIHLNSAFANAMGDAAPQLRDRVYIVFWKRQYKRPNFDKFLRPPAYCPTCDKVVRAMWSPKPAPKGSGKWRPMRYGPTGGQYLYRCPQKTCRFGQVYPLARPADAILDYSLPTEVIGERKKPLAPASRERIAGGLWRHRDRFLAGMAGHTFERHPGVRTWPTTRPMVTQHTTAALGLVTTVGGGWDADAVTDQPLKTFTATEKDALVVPVEARGGVRARSAREPLRAQTTRHQDTLVQPPAMYAPLRAHGRCVPTDEEPLQTFSAGGTHHAIVMRNNTARGDAGQMSTPTDEPIRTLTTAGHQSLIEAPRAVYAYDTGEMRPVTDPLPTQTTIEGDALVEMLSPFIDGCTLRMLALDEIKDGMNFGRWTRLLGNSKKDKVRMLGNAVTPCSSRDLGACLMEAICGIDIDLAPYTPFNNLW